MISVLLIHVSAIRETKSKPTSWINLDTTENVNRIIVESVRRVATEIVNRVDFRDWLEVFVDWKVEPDAGDEFIRSIEEDLAVWSLWIAIHNPTAICRNVDVFMQPAVHKTDYSKVTDIAARTCAALQLVESWRIVALIQPPAIERNNTYAERIIRTSEPNLAAKHQTVEA